MSDVGNKKALGSHLRDTERILVFKTMGQGKPLTEKMPSPSPTVDIGLTRKYVIFKGFFDFTSFVNCGILFRGLLSGRRESNPVYIHPMDAYYRYTTTRCMYTHSTKGAGTSQIQATSLFHTGGEKQPHRGT